MGILHDTDSAHPNFSAGVKEQAAGQVMEFLGCVESEEGVSLQIHRNPSPKTST